MTEILAPFIAAVLLAYLLEPAASRLTQKGLPRSLSSLLAIAMGHDSKSGPHPHLGLPGQKIIPCHFCM